MLRDGFHQGPQMLWFLLLSYTVTILLANWFDIRLLQLGPVVTDAGTLIFPLSFVISDVITEVYGYKFARRAIWCGFVFNLFFLAYGALVTHLPGPADAPYNANFDTLMNIEWRIILASILSYFCAEPVNAYVLAQLKIRWQGRHMAARFVSSTVLASFLDSAVFSCFAFIGILSWTGVYHLALTMWLIKIAVELLTLPLSTFLAKRLKAIEGLDIFDRHTKFSLWRFDTLYSRADNDFGRTLKS